MDLPTATPHEPSLQAPTALRGVRVLVLGLGQSGLAMARWCAQRGAQVCVADTRSQPPHALTLQQELPDVQIICGSLDATLLEQSQAKAVFKSPGLAPADVAALWQAAQQRGLRCGGELSLFADALQELKLSISYRPQVLAITGTNGKTTVTALTGLLVERAGKTVAVAGNIGPSLLDTLSQHMAECSLPEVWVLELSSFQLDDAPGFEPTAATVLNITQDHLDWHGSMQAYTQAKAKVFGAAALAVVNRDDPLVKALAQTLTAPPPVRAPNARPVRLGPRRQTSFGLGLPLAPGDFGLEDVNGMTWLVRALEADETVKPRRGAGAVELELHLQRLMPADALRIRGRHNSANALAALALASAAGCALGPMLYGLREYRGEPHRVEPVGVIRDVEFFDDSKGTNVGATVAALTGLGAERRVVVILGGEGKGQDFSPLQQPVARFARAVVLIGRDAPQIRAALGDLPWPVLSASSMAEAVALAHDQAQAGDAVLLSPACASFDMFKNYEHRAQMFVQAVSERAIELGAPLEAVL